MDFILSFILLSSLLVYKSRIKFGVLIVCSATLPNLFINCDIFLYGFLTVFYVQNQGIYKWREFYFIFFMGMPPFPLFLCNCGANRTNTMLNTSLKRRHSCLVPPSSVILALSIFIDVSLSSSGRSLVFLICSIYFFINYVYSILLNVLY